MVSFEILNNLNFYGAFINVEEVDFIGELERYENLYENKFSREQEAKLSNILVNIN